jgi:alkylhydroperoxidase/carboxymuconolactone decarboxylase family protein YurZ
MEGTVSMEANKELPAFLQKVIAKYPGVWEKYEELGEAVGAVEGLDDKSRHLVKLALAVGAQSQGAIHSHARRCLKVGCTSAEIYHVALLAITSLGWSGAMKTLSWIDEELQEL